MKTIFKKISTLFFLAVLTSSTLFGQNVKCENPYPNCLGLNGIKFTDAQNGWAVGINGMVTRYDGVKWTQDLNQNKTKKNLLNAFFINATTGWICGVSGTILKYKDGEYVLQSSNTTEQINALFFTDENHGWAVCSNNVILKYDAGVWIIQKQNTNNTYWSFNNIFMNSNTEGWAVGNQGNIFQYNGTTWSLVLSPTNLNLEDIDFAGNTGFIVGESGIILKFDGINSWKTIVGTGGYVYDLFSVDVVNETSAWASGMYGTIINYNGTTWTSGSANGPWYLGISMINPQMGWTFSGDGVIKKITNGVLEINNTPIQNENGTPYSSSPVALVSISLKPNGDGWMMSESGVLFELKSNVWKKQTTKLKSSRYYFSVDIFNDTLGFIVGSEGIIYKYDGISWNLVKTPFDNDISSSYLNKVFILDAENAYVVGNKGIVLHYNKGTWQKIIIPGQGTTDFYDVQFINKDLGWFSGVNGTIINYKNGVYTKLPFSNTKDRIQKVFYFDETEGWVNGSSNLYHFKNNTWTEVPTDKMFVKDFYFSDRDNGYIIGPPYYQGGSGGVISIYKDGTCTRLPNFNFSQRIMSIDFSSSNQGLIVGDGELMLRIGDKPEIVTRIVDPMLDVRSTNNEQYYLVPNPSTDVVTIFKQGNKIYMGGKVVVITTLDGKVVMNKKLDNNQIDISSFNVGMYFLAIEGESGFVKFIKE